MADLRKVTYCGLYCGLCAQGGRIPKQAGDLRESMRKEGYEFWGPEIPGFAEFWRFLGGLAESADGRGCRDSRCGPPFCAIRKCAPAKGVEACPFCEDYPCPRVLGIAKGYPTLLSDGAWMREIGLEKWIAEQEERASTGFAYVDIRRQPYDIPEK